MTKAYETRDGALSADFHDKSTGYDVNFMEAGDQGRRWSFKVKDQTKNRSLLLGLKDRNLGFVELVSGGHDEETYTELCQWSNRLLSTLYHNCKNTFSILDYLEVSPLAMNHCYRVPSD